MRWKIKMKKRKGKEEKIANHDKRMKKRDKDWKPGGRFLTGDKKRKR